MSFHNLLANSLIILAVSISKCGNNNGSGSGSGGSGGTPSVVYACVAYPENTGPTQYRFQSVKDYGALGDGVHDDTEAIQRAINESDTVYIPTGTYRVYSLNIPSNRYIKTDGYDTHLKQTPKIGGNTDARILRLKGSNITLEKISFSGNIKEDKGEQNHAIYMRPEPVGIFSKITIYGAKGNDLRGDVISIGGLDSLTYCKNVTIGEIYGSNIYRNTLSVTAGDSIKTGFVQSRNAGLFGIDIEGDPNNAPLSNINIDYADIERLGMLGGGTVARKIYMKNVNINSEYQWSNPGHVDQQFTYDSFVLRDVDDVLINSITIQNTKRMYLWGVPEGGNFQTTNIRLNNLSLERLNNAVTNAFNVFYCRPIQGLSISTLSTRLPETEKQKLNRDLQDCSIVTNNIIEH